MLPRAKATLVEYKFANDSSNATTGTHGTSFRGRYSAGSLAGTYAATIQQPVTLKRVILTSNGNEYSGGAWTVSVALGAGGEGYTEVYNSGAIPRSEWSFQTNFTLSGIQDSCIWVSPPLDISRHASPANPLFLSNEYTASSITGGPEGFGVTIIAEVMNDIGSTPNFT